MSVLLGPGPELRRKFTTETHCIAATKCTSPAKRRNAKQLGSIFFFFASLREELQCSGLEELSFHQGFIGPLDLNAKFLELAVKRGSCETQDVSAFFDIAGGAFEGLHDCFTLNLPHRHKWRNNKGRTKDSRTMKSFR